MKKLLSHFPSSLRYKIAFAVLIALLSSVAFVHAQIGVTGDVPPPILCTNGDVLDSPIPGAGF